MKYLKLYDVRALSLPLRKCLCIPEFHEFWLWVYFVQYGYGQDGYLRVFAWPTCQLILDKPHAHRSIQDIDIRLQSIFRATCELPC